MQKNICSQQAGHYKDKREPMANIFHLNLYKMKQNSQIYCRTKSWEITYVILGNKIKNNL